VTIGELGIRGLADISADSVGHDAANTVDRRPEAEQSSPAGQVRPTVVRDDDDGLLISTADGMRADLCAS
jgi:hypothetical protein